MLSIVQYSKRATSINRTDKEQPHDIFEWLPQQVHLCFLFTVCVVSTLYIVVWACIIIRSRTYQRYEGFQNLVSALLPGGAK